MKNLPLSTIRDKAGALSATQGFGFIGKLLDIYDDISKKSTEKKDEIIFARAESIITRAIELGKQGRLKIAPEHISVSATANCNLKCVMCPGHAGKSGPKLSIDEAEMLFVTLADEDIDFGQPKTLDMTNGEPTLNRDLVAIYQRFKELFPRAKISMISNATIPVKGRFRKAYELSDIIGLSMDGATAETYERIRKGSVYRNVVRNIKDIAKIKKQGVNCDSLQLMFVAMDQNIHELPEMVRLTHSVGISELFVQESEVRGGSPFNTEGQNITLGLPENELASIVTEAKSEASRLGIRLSLTPPFEKALLSKQPAKNRTEEKKRKPPQAKLDVAIKTCAYPWLFSPRIVQDTENGIHAGTVCCHMPNQSQRVSLKNRPDMKEKSIVDMFNSEFYWDIRSGLLDGTLAKDACKGCQYFNVTQWTAAQLRQLETVIDAVDS